MLASRVRTLQRTLWVARSKQNRGPPMPDSVRVTKLRNFPPGGVGVRSEGRPYAPDMSVSQLEKQAVNINYAILQVEKEVNSLKDRLGGVLHHNTLATASKRGKTPRPLETIRVGDFVQLQTPMGVDTGVVLPSSGQYGLRSVKANVTEFDMVTVTGEVRSVYANAVLFYIPEFVDPKLAEEAKKVTAQEEVVVAEGSVQRQERQQANDSGDGDGDVIQLREEKEIFDRRRFKVRAKICMKLRALLQQTEHRKQGMFPFFEQLYLSGEYKTQASTREQNSQFRTATQVSAELLKKTGMRDDYVALYCAEPASIFAAHQLITAAPHIFRMDNTAHMSTQTFRLLPPIEQDILTTVKELVTTSLEYLNSPATSIKGLDPIQGFSQRVQKVKDVRKKAIETISADIRAGEPSAKQLGGGINSIWEENDRRILRFLRSTLCEPRKIVTERQIELALYILQRCGYDVELTPLPNNSTPRPPFEALTEEKKLLLNFFGDLGYLAPWDDQATLINEFIDIIEPANVEPGHLNLKDDVHLRRDHHESVYVIDDESASELDDGISVERTEDRNKTWIHVHIADPTAAIDVDDAVAKDAEKRFSSVYMIQGRWAMLPDTIANKLGLRPNAANKDQPLRAMTFSAKVDQIKGTVSEINISLSRLHNVKVMSYKEADKVMKGSANNDEDLSLLHTLAKALSDRRTKEYDAVQFDTDWIDSNVKLSNLPLPASPLRQTTFASDSLDPVLFTGKPAITLSQSYRAEVDESCSASKMTVSEMALLAGRSAAKFAAVHRIPVVYRYQPSSGSPEKDQEVLNLRDEHGVMPTGAFLRKGVALGAATVAAEPCEHFMMGVRTRRALSIHRTTRDDLLGDAGYVRVTSPLRRYADLMMHWQLRSFIQQTHGSSTEVINAARATKHESLSSTLTLPFTHDDLYPKLAHISRMERFHKSLERANVRAWKTYCLHDAFTATQCDQQAQRGLLSDTYEAVVDRSGIRPMKDGQNRLSVTLSGLDMPALSLLPKSMNNVKTLPQLNAHPACQIGHSFPVRIIDVQRIPGSTSILVEPV